VFSQTKEVIYILETYDKTKNIDEQKELYIRGQLSTAFANSSLYEAIDLPGIDAMIDINALSEKGYLSPEAKAALGKIPGCKYFLSTELAASDGEITISVKLLEIESLFMVKGKSASEYIKNDRESIIAACKRIISDLFGAGSTFGNSGTSSTAGIGITNTFTDPRDGKTYKTVKIGNQIWLAENLLYSENNEFQQQINSNASWLNNIKHNGWCFCPTAYSYSGNNKYDCVLYQWEAAKKACPSGWHLPSIYEYYELFDLYGGINDTNTFKSLLSDGVSNFNAYSVHKKRMGLYPYNSGGFFDSDWVEYWTSTIYDDDQSWIIYFDTYKHSLDISGEDKNSGLPIRCIRD